MPGTYSKDELQVRMREQYGFNFTEFYHDENALDKVFNMHRHD
jgi:Ca2+-binding EF-hand superfamily protein